ncbi:5'/3'-nucleotidase SurE [Solitalea koreensis]|uniref:5'-nucleotidase SurE n=1 Tax=Solitalea koreensis TaxID=543615 RepID=A0A521AE36_9SPHI|nr:5'/3'-nucleotidase SurE [Solitalea koreensis]SMO33038.1 5'-nucleotidase /3'-nucleotidase /exopolyphosphatase [Solitalea koreensis]
MKKQRPTILVTNDDGITAPGIKVLMEVMAELGDVVVVAPDAPQSAMGHAVTIAKPLRLDKVNIYDGIDMYQSSGTPVDCVKLAVNKVLHKKPDLLVSGINHGYNSSINVIYSGTMSAAMEGAIEGIPSIGFSLGDFRQDADFEPVRNYVKQVAEQVLEHGLPVGSLLNVNFPPIEEIKGMKICRQAVAKWKEEFDERIDPHGRKYFWLTGKFLLNDNGEDTDEFALSQGYASIVPVHFDFTAYNAIPFLNNLSFNSK